MPTTTRTRSAVRNRPSRQSGRSMRDAPQSPAPTSIPPRDLHRTQSAKTSLKHCLLLLLLLQCFALGRCRRSRLQVVRRPHGCRTSGGDVRGRLRRVRPGWWWRPVLLARRVPPHSRQDRSLARASMPLCTKCAPCRRLPLCRLQSGHLQARCLKGSDTGERSSADWRARTGCSRQSLASSRKLSQRSPYRCSAIRMAQISLAIQRSKMQVRTRAAQPLHRARAVAATGCLRPLPRTQAAAKPTTMTQFLL